MKQENDRKSREEVTLSEIPSRGEWLLDGYTGAQGVFVQCQTILFQLTIY